MKAIKNVGSKIQNVVLNINYSNVAIITFTLFIISLAIYMISKGEITTTY